MGTSVVDTAAKKKMEIKKNHNECKGTFLSESTDVFVITANSFLS